MNTCRQAAERTNTRVNHWAAREDDLLQAAVDDDRMTVIQRVYLRAEKGTLVIHDWNVATAAAVAASQEA